MRKRIFYFCIAIAIALTCCIGCQNEVSAADTMGTETPADQFTYQYSSAYQGIELTKYLGKDTVVHIPSEIGGVPVTAIGADCFYEKKKLTEVTMPDTVVSIGDQAFGFCRALENVTWSENLKSIGNYAFRECKIKSLYMPESLTFLGVSAFFGCDALEEVVCSNGLTELNATFCNCFSLKYIKLPSSPQFTKIGDCAFVGCRFEKMEIPASVTEIGDEAFDSNLLKKIVFPKDSKLEKIGNEAFAGCDFKKITLPASVKELGTYLFDGCRYLDKILFEKGAKIKEIPNYCFASSYGLKEVDIPENVTNIGRALFSDRHEGYYKVKKINIKGNKIKKIASTAFCGLDKKGTITVPKKSQKKYTNMFKKKKWYKKTMKIKAIKKK